MPHKNTMKRFLTSRSILWRAVLHSVLVAVLMIVVLSIVSYLVTGALLEQQAVTQLLNLASSGYLSIDFSPQNLYALSHHEAQAGALLLARNLGVVGLFLLGCSVLLALSLSKRLTNPLIILSEKVAKLHPGRWTYRRTLKSGDELEDLDRHIASLAKRLQSSHEELEKEVEKRTESLKEEYAKDRAIINSLSMGLLVVGSRGKIKEANAAAGTLLKRDPDDLLGQSAVDMLGFRHQQHPVLTEENPVLQCLKTHKEVRANPEVHLTITCADHSYLSARVSVSPLMQGRKLLGAIVLFQDVTAERQLDYMKSEFITLASHQLRTPLSTIQWYLELLSTEEQSALTDDQKSFITELRLASHRMNNIVSELMDASRLQRGGVTPIVQNVNLKQFAKNMAGELKMLGAEKRIACEVDMPNESVSIRTDPMLLSVVMQNLVSNAVKYSHEEGMVHIVLTSDSKEIAISIQDYGIGIPHADQERIFQKLFRAHNARNLDVNGSGLGLHSSQMIAEKLGASLSFESEENKGSTFKVVFPVEKKKPQKRKK